MCNDLNSVGVWGRLRYDYLKAARPAAVSVMRANGTLIPHLREINEAAEEMMYRLVPEIAKREGITEQLKAEDQMAWVGAMNNIRDRVREIVNSELICT